MNQPDTALLGTRIAARDPLAFDEAYREYAPSVLSYVRRFVPRDDAEDVMQRTFLDVWRQAHSYDPQQRFASWLFTIAHHRAVDYLRSQRATVVDVQTLRQLTGEDGRETVERFADATDVRSAVALLPDHERHVVELAYFSGLTQAEIASHLALPIGTIKARASRGTRRLAQLMTQGDGSDD